MKTEKKLIAVYGSLRKNLHNHDLIEDQEYIGSFWTPPLFTLHSLGPFPGLKKDGHTSVLMEIYEADDATVVSVNDLEQYNPKIGAKNEFYIREKLNTPYGEAYVYFYVPNAEKAPIVQSGDWEDYYNREIKVKNVLDHAKILPSSN